MAEMKWKGIGFGIFARMIKDVPKLPVTSSLGPPECNVFRLVVRSLMTGKVIDECIIGNVSDQILRRSIQKSGIFRVELIMHDALSEHVPEEGRRRGQALLPAPHRAGGRHSEVRRHGPHGGLELGSHQARRPRDECAVGPQQEERA